MRRKKERTVLGFDGSFMRVCDKVFDVLLLGFLWILCSIPLITVGASTTALYYAVVKCVKNDDGYPVKEFFHSFRLNFVPGILIWIFIVAATFVMQLNIGILMAETSGYVGMFFICFYGLAAVFLLAVFCYIFPALSRFDMNIGWMIKVSMYMTVRYFGTTLALLLVLVCTGALVFRFPMLVFFAPGPVVFLMSEFLERVLKRHEPDREEEIQEEARI